MSFDISALHGADVVADFGNSLDIHDFYVVSGTFLADIPVTATNFLILGTGPDFDDTVPLRYELQKAIDDGKDYFQIRLELDATTNGDGVIDSKDIYNYSRDVWFWVTYDQ